MNGVKRRRKRVKEGRVRTEKKLRSEEIKMTCLTEIKLACKQPLPMHF